MSNSKRLGAINARLNKIPKLTTPISHATFQVDDVRDLLAVVERAMTLSEEDECPFCNMGITMRGVPVTKHDVGCWLAPFEDNDTQEVQP